MPRANARTIAARGYGLYHGTRPLSHRDTKGLIDFLESTLHAKRGRGFQTENMVPSNLRTSAISLYKFLGFDATEIASLSGK